MARSNKYDPQLVKLAEELKEDAAKNAKYIHYESFGKDKNKKKKNEEACDRGSSSGPARYCSAHLRQIYPANILGDAQKSEFCVNGRQNNCIDNQCNLCNIHLEQYEQIGLNNIAESLCIALGGNNDDNDPQKRIKRLKSFLNSHITDSYPGTKGDRSSLRIWINDEIWAEYYIKLTAFSAILKTSAPSGYKYKDRISISRCIKLQGNTNKDIIFTIFKDPNYNDLEYEQSRPVVNCVGFWNLKSTKDPIRTIIHLNQDQAVNVCFCFYVKHWQNINSIKVQLIQTRQCLGTKDEVTTLWQFPAESNNDSSSVSNSRTPPHIATNINTNTNTYYEHQHPQSPIYPSLPPLPPISLPSPTYTQNYMQHTNYMNHNNYDFNTPNYNFTPSISPFPTFTRFEDEQSLYGDYFYGPTRGISECAEQFRYHPYH